jgi:hypothetical protein
MQADRIFELAPDGPVDQAPYTPWRTVRDLARSVGLDVMTADQLTARGINPHDALVISYDWPPATDALVGAGAQLAVLTSLEPPIIAWELYYRLPRLSARFPHVWLFAGGAERAAPGAKFHPLHFPQVRQSRPLSTEEWRSRRFLVAIHSNKAIVRSFARWFDTPREVSVKRTLATWRYPPIGADLYLERMRAAAHFADRADFDMFGQGWHHRHPAVPDWLHRAVLRAYRGPVPEKLVTLERYRFCLCLENSRFAGYVSEKIFDCFFARTIPIYLGAPDIERYVPREAFIDLRDFREYRDLERLLGDLDDTAQQRYLQAADAFVQSAGFDPFTVESFAQQVVGMLTDVNG